PPDAARMERARALSQNNHCNFCHQSNYAGQENVPRLAGQREDYLLKTLRGYKDNSRRGYDAQMSEVVYAMKDEEFVDLAYFRARLKRRGQRALKSVRYSPRPAISACQGATQRSTTPIR